MKTIFLTGVTGQVGFELRRTLAPLGQVLAPARAELDLADISAVNRYLQDKRPELIVNAAAWTAVDAAEAQAQEAQRLNADLPAALAAYARAQNIWLVHYSSDYVYPGTGEHPWRESDSAAPLSVYGQTKLAGDQAVMSVGQHLIFRTSWVYSARGSNFMKTMLRLGEEHQELAIVADQWGAPTSARLIAQISTFAVKSILDATPPASGIYHLAPQGETHWAGFAREIFAQAAHHGMGLRVQKVKDITTEDYPTPARRPRNSRLNLEKITQALNLCLPSWQEDVQLTVQEYINTRGN